MMKVPVFIGDEVSAAGFRLAGVRIRTPQAEELPSVIAWAKKNTSLILITQEYLNQLNKAEQQQLVRLLDPPVAVIPDINSKTPLVDLATQLRSQLGVLE